MVIKPFTDNNKTSRIMELKWLLFDGKDIHTRETAPRSVKLFTMAASLPLDINVVGLVCHPSCDR